VGFRRLLRATRQDDWGFLKGAKSLWGDEVRLNLRLSSSKKWVRLSLVRGALWDSAQRRAPKTRQATRATADVDGLPLLTDPCCPTAEPLWCCEEGTTCCDGLQCCTVENCCPNNTCCPWPCDECIDNGTLSGGTITVNPDPACLQDIITFTASGVSDDGGEQRRNCVLETIAPVAPTYTWELTIPPGYPAPLPPLSGTGPAVSVVAKAPGTYSVTFKANADRDCPPPEITLDPAVKTLAFAAAITANPTSIPATTVWAGMPANISQSTISVPWNPPECEGTVEIVEIDPIEGYVPPDEGTLTPDGQNTWRYDAFTEPAAEHCPKLVRVWIAAMMGDVELSRVSILVKPVHTHWTQGASSNFANDYNYIVWKYAGVLATSGGAFTGGVTISTNGCVGCPFGCVYACTTLNPFTGTYSVAFGTTTFTGTENQAASIIGHELVHTTAADECPAYTWEFNNDAATGVFQCDTAYL